jgi:hypothetical protein
MSKKTKTFEKIAPSATIVDHEYQRAQDEARVAAIAKNYDQNLIGVPVLSRRQDGALVRVDGQHRLAAAIVAGQGDVAVMCEVHTGLTQDEEARLFLRLNGSRSAVRVYDKFRARCTAREEFATSIVHALGTIKVRVAANKGKNTVCAIQALEKAHRNGNLVPTIQALKVWADGSQEAFDRALITSMSSFLKLYPSATPLETANKLRNHAPSKIVAKINRERDARDVSTEVAGQIVFREIYNERRAAKSRLPPVHLVNDPSAEVA